MFITFFISAFKFHVMIVKLNVYFNHSNSYRNPLAPYVEFSRTLNCVFTTCTQNYLDNLV